MAEARYTAKIDHTEKTIEALYRMQRRTYDRLRIILRMVLGFVLIVLAVAVAAETWLKAVLLLAGAWLVVSGDFPAQIRADRAVQERKGVLPVMRYKFFEETLKLTGEGSMDIGYEKLRKLVGDASYFYLFLSKESVCMLERESLTPQKQDEFKRFLEERTGLHWHTEKGLLALNLADLILIFRDRKRK